MKKSGLVILSFLVLYLTLQTSWNGVGVVEAQLPINLPSFTALNSSDPLFQSFETYVVQPMKNYRTFLLANQLPFNPTFEVGKAITNGLIGWIASWPRYQIYDITNATFLQTAGLKQFIIPVANGTDYTQLSQTASAYGQGLVLFVLFGIGGMLVTLLFGLYWVAIICWSKIWCFCCCCRAPFVFKKDRKCCDFCCLFAAEDKKKQRSSYDSWKSRTIFKFSFRIILQILLFVTFLGFLLLIAVWGIFVNQLATDISVMLDIGTNVTSSGASKALSAATSANFILPSTITIVNSSLIQFSNNIKANIPSQSQLNGYTTCVSDIFNQLPNATILTNYVNSLYGSLNSLPPISSLQSNVSSINSSLSILGGTAVNGLYTAAATAVVETSYASGLSGAVNHVENARVNLNTNAGTLLHNLAYISQSIIDGNVTNLSTHTSQVVTSLQNLGADTETFNSRITKLNNLLTTFNNLKTDYPSFLSSVNSLFNSLSSSNMTTAALELSNRMNGLHNVITNSSFTAVVSAIQVFNTTANDAESKIATFRTTLQGVYNTLTGLPSTTIITAEFDKISNISSKTQCVQDLGNFITILNNTLLLIPSNMTAPLGLLTQLGPTIAQYNASFSSIINNIQSISTSFAPQLNSTLNSLDLSSTFAAFSNLVSITNAMNTLSQQVHSAVSQSLTNGTMNWDSLRATLTSFSNTMGHISASTLQSVFTQLGSAISNFNTATITNVLNQLPNESGYSGGTGTCSLPACPSATLTSLKNTLSTSLSNLNVQALSGSYNNFGVASRLSSAAMAVSNSTWNSVTPVLTTQLQTLNQIMNPVHSAMTTAFNSISTIRTSLVSAVGSLPFSNMNSLFGTVNSVLGQVPSQSSIQSQLASLTSISSNVDVNMVTALLNAASTGLNSLDLSSLVSTAFGSLSSASGMFSAFVSLISPIKESIDVLLPVISGFDGYRLLLSGLVIFILILPLPFLVTGAICCPKQPGFLLCATAIYLIIAFGCFIVFAFGVPIDLILYDNCPIIEKELTTALTYLPSSLTQSLAINQTIPLGSLGSIPINVDLIGTGVQFINGTCDGTDSLTTTLESILTILSTVISTTVNTAIGQVNLPHGLRFNPILLSSLSTTSNQIISSIRTNVFGELLNNIGCSSINSLYKNAKFIVCTHIQYWITSALFLTFLLAVLMLVASIVFPTFYICFICTWTRGVIVPPLGKSKVQPSEASTELKEVNTSTSGKARIKKVTIVETIEQ